MGLAISKPNVLDGDRAYSHFLEKFKQTHTYLSAKEINQNAIMTWNSMTPKQKSKFLVGTRTPPPRQKRNRPKIRARAKPRTTMRPTRGTNAKARGLTFSKSRNKTFRNFLREFRKKNRDLDDETAFKLGAKAWCKLYEEEKLLLDELLT